MIHFKHCLILVLPFVISCSNSKSVYNQKTELLEVPPRMTMVQQTAREAPAEDDKKEPEQKGLGGKTVSFSQAGQQATLKIKKTFDRSWEILEQALTLKNIKVTDKDREQGIFYVTYDTDQQQSDDASFMDKMSFFFFDDDALESSYTLTAKWKESTTDVTSALIKAEENDLLDDGEDDRETPSDHGNLLLKTLYKTIKDDLIVH